MLSKNVDLNNTVILVTGAAGFVGANLVMSLLSEAEGTQIIGIDSVNDYYDDGSLEGHALESGYVERDIAGGCGKVAVIVSAAVALTGLAALIASRLRQRLRLLFQQFVQGYFYTSSN